MAAHCLDVRGLLCPMPVIRTQARVNQLAPGEELEILVTDPGALRDIPAWCRVHGHEVIATEEGRDETTIWVRVGGAAP